MAGSRVYSVSELLRHLIVDLSRYNDIAVEGEVSNFTRSAAGHLYFSIKDARAQIKVVLFATNARFLRFKIENGLQLIVRGRISIYEAKGDLQLNAVSAEPAGLGALQLAFEQLKKRLAEEGLFDPARKKPIPMLPQRIAVVTSPSGAAIRDILNVLGRRFEGLSLRSEEHTSELQSRLHLVCRLLLEKKKKKTRKKKLKNKQKKNLQITNNKTRSLILTTKKTINYQSQILSHDHRHLVDYYIILNIQR